MSLAVRPDALTIAWCYCQPLGKIVRAWHDAARGGLGLVRRYFDKTRMSLGVAPFQPEDLAERNPAKAPKARQGARVGEACWSICGEFSWRERSDAARRCVAAPFHAFQ